MKMEHRGSLWAPPFVCASETLGEQGPRQALNASPVGKPPDADNMQHRMTEGSERIHVSGPEYKFRNQKWQQFPSKIGN